MVKIRLKEVAHSYVGNSNDPNDYALKRLDLSCEDGGAYALLGPSGCGKTTLLNIISGLLKPTRGQIIFGDEDVTDLPTAERNIAQIFQFPVVYDTMTVFENLAFPLKNRGHNSADIQERVEEIAEILDLTDVLSQRALHLTADAKQKISLGRGLVRRSMNAILFDEPLTVIDPLLKWQLRSQLKALHKRFGFTMIYVTHDQTEALTFADKVLVIYEGEVVQMGTPEDLFERPAHTFVGYFIGSPGMNFLPCTLNGDEAVVAGQSLALGKMYQKTKSENIKLGIRPEYLRIVEKSEGGLVVTVDRVSDIGRHKVVRTSLGEHLVNVICPHDQDVQIGEACLALDSSHICLYEDEHLLEATQ